MASVAFLLLPYRMAVWYFFSKASISLHARRRRDAPIPSSWCMETTMHHIKSWAERSRWSSRSCWMLWVSAFIIQPSLRRIATLGRVPRELRYAPAADAGEFLVCDFCILDVRPAVAHFLAGRAGELEPCQRVQRDFRAALPALVGRLRFAQELYKLALAFRAAQEHEPLCADGRKPAYRLLGGGLSYQPRKLPGLPAAARWGRSFPPPVRCCRRTASWSWRWSRAF